MASLNMPYGGALTDLIVSNTDAQCLKEIARDYQSWDLTERQLCDIELLLNGGFSPLTGFLGEDDYNGVVENMRLADGKLWPLPITLDVTGAFAESVSIADDIALLDREGVMVAVMTISDIWTPDKGKEAKEVFGTSDAKHPAVDYLLNKANPVYIGGALKGIELPRHYDFVSLRDTPQELRSKFKKMGWRKIVAFQTRNPMHRAHYEITFRAAKDIEASLLINPVVGMTKPGDIDHYSRVRCYEHLLERYPEQTTTLSLLPLAMRMGGPREAMLHAIIRKNYGCSHFIVGRDHAGPGKDSNGEDIYGPYDAQELLEQHKKEIGINIIPFKMMVYVKEKDVFMPVDQVGEDMTALNVSGTELRYRLDSGVAIPEWFSYPEVVEELRKAYPAKHKQGFTIFFTGLSGSGKSTIANALMIKLMEIGGRPITLLDGDIVRKNLSKDLGFSKEHRDINIRRIGFVASEITKNGGVAICAPIAPYTETRRDVRNLIKKLGGFIEVYVSTSIEVCEYRDRKGLYAKARAGILKEFTGISAPYEEPQNAQLVIDTFDCSPDEAAQRILLHLEKEGYLG